MRALSFGNVFREALGRLYGKDPLEAVEELRKVWAESYTVAAIDIIYCAMAADCRLERTPISFTIQEVGRWFDDAADDDVAPVLKAYMQSQQERPILPEHPVKKDHTPKKKQRGKT